MIWYGIDDTTWGAEGYNTKYNIFKTCLAGLLFGYSTSTSSKEY